MDPGNKPTDWETPAKSFGVMFLLMSGYYLLRPWRDVIASATSLEGLPHLFGQTLVVSIGLVALFQCVSPAKRRVAAVISYYAFAVGLLAAIPGLVACPALVRRILFVATTGCSFFFVALFWAALSESLTPASSPHTLSSAAAGASLGAIAGPALSLVLLRAGGIDVALLGAAALIGFSGYLLGCLPPACPGGARSVAYPKSRFPAAAVVAAAAYIGLLQIVGTLIYVQQLRVVGVLMTDLAGRAHFFANLDLAANGFAVAMQLVVPAFLRRAGLGWCLAVAPVAAALSLGYLVLWPSTPALFASGVARRTAEYAFARPARETVFRKGSLEDRNRFKLSIDVGVARGGDAVGAMLAGRMAPLAPFPTLLAQMVFVALFLATGMIAAFRLRHTE